MDNKNKRGVAAIQQNHIKFDAMIAEMKAAGKKFPVNQFGRPCISFVAKKIGCGRDTIRKGVLAKSFAAAIIELGVELKEDNNTKKSNNKHNGGNQKKLYKDLKDANKKIEKLEGKLNKLQCNYNNLKNDCSEEELRFKRMLKDGVRFRL